MEERFQICGCKKWYTVTCCHLCLQIPEVLLWAKEQNEEKSLNLTQFTEHFNNMSYWYVFTDTATHSVQHVFPIYASRAL